MKFDVTGMTCSACSARIEKGVAKLEGVKSVSVNLLTHSMVVEFDAAKLDAGKIIKGVEDLGYGAAEKAAVKPAAKAGQGAAPPKNAASEELRGMKNRLLGSILFTVPLFYLSMGEMLHWPLPAFFHGMENAMGFALTLFLLAIPVVFLNRKYFQVGFKNLLRLSPNMDSLIAIGSGAAFGYGIFALYQIAWGMGHENMDLAHKFSMDLYFESAAMILTLITLGKFLEARAKGRTSEAIQKLMDLSPKMATVFRNGQETVISVEEVLPGDVLVVKAGEAVPVDGAILDGAASLDESAITGESLPVEKTVGDAVTGGTMNRSGYFHMEAKAVGENTTLAKIIQLVEDATSSKAPIAKLADKISGIFVPVVIAIAVCAAILWALLGHGLQFSLTVGIAVLVISCPCALGLATPTAIMVGTGKGASNGILLKSAEALETLHGVQVVVLDKTGTVTEGKPAVTDLLPNGVTQEELLGLAASLEKMSGHPLAAPIVAEAEKAGLALQETKDYQMIQGQGIVGTLEGKPCYGGNRKLMEASGVSVEALAEQESRLTAQGKTLLYFAQEKTLWGAVALADTVKPTSQKAIAELTRMGIEVILLTGDNQGAAQAIARQVGLKKVVAEVLPEDKEREVRALQAAGKTVAMVGDGINDAPALARADVGIAIGAGTDVAMESADVVLMKSDLYDVVAAIRLSKAVMRNIRQNLFWAFIYNVIGIPVAAGALYPAFGILLNPMIAAGAMSFSSVSVVTNALRLRWFSLGKGHENPNQQRKKEEEQPMIKTIRIEGMSCMHCVGAVKKALGAVAGVGEVTVDLEKKQATVELKDPAVSDDALRHAIEEEGFQVVGIA